jgi:hypothetical protein
MSLSSADVVDLVLLLVGFAAGFGVSELLSRRRKASRGNIMEDGRFSINNTSLKAEKSRAPSSVSVTITNKVDGEILRLVAPQHLAPRIGSNLLWCPWTASAALFGADIRRHHLSTGVRRDVGAQRWAQDRLHPDAASATRLERRSRARRIDGNMLESIGSPANARPKIFRGHLAIHSSIRNRHLVDLLPVLIVPRSGRGLRAVKQFNLP